MGILAWLLFGFIVGFIANALEPTPGWGGLLGSIILGISGALVGGFIGSAIFGIGTSGFNLASFIVAIAGSLLLIAISRAFRKV